MSEWITDLVSDAIRNPISKEPEIVKTAELSLPDPNYIAGIDEQLSACRMEKESILKQKARGDDVESDLKIINDELDELLECRALATKEVNDALQTKGELTPEIMASAVEAFRVALSTDAMHATDRLKQMYPDLTSDEIDQVKEKYWEPIFGGTTQVEANLQGELVDGQFLGEVLDDLLILEVKLPELLDGHLENVFGITNAALKEELIRRAIVMSPDLEHRDPEEIYTDPHMQTTSPHSSDPGMMPMADGLKTYTFVDEQGVTESVQAASEEEAWMTLAKNFAYDDPNYLKNEIGIKLQSVATLKTAEGQGYVCGKCGGEFEMKPGKGPYKDLDEVRCPDCGKRGGLRKAADDAAPVPATDAPPAQPAAPAPSVEDMVTNRVQLQEKLSSMEDNLAKLRESMMKDLLPLQEKTKQEEPLLIEALRKVDGMQTTVGNWQAFLKTRAGYDKLNKAKLLDKITAVAQQEDERIYKLIKQLEGTKAYRTEVAPSENLEVKRVKESGLELEAAPQNMKEWWGRIKSWFSRTFYPQLDYTAGAMQELGDYLDAVQAQPLPQ